MQKRILSFLLTLALLIGLLPTAVFGQWAQAAASDATALLLPVEQQTSVPAGYTGIYTAEGLKNIRDNMRGKYILMNDIDLSGIDWVPLEAPSTAIAPDFDGILDGNGYTIRNLSCTGESKAALFRSNSGIIKNLALTGTVTLNNTRYLSASAAGLCSSNDKTIENCTVAATITNAGSTYTTQVAGISSYNFGTISHCRFTGTIQAGSGTEALGGWSEITAGGIAASCFGTLTACEMTGNLILHGQVSKVSAGGLFAYGSSSLDQCRVTGTISLTGSAKNPTLVIGGLAGETGYQKQYTDCSFNGKLSIALALSGSGGSYHVGGLFGESNSAATIQNCYVSGILSDSSTVEDGSLTVAGTPAWCIGELYWGSEKVLSGLYYPSGTFDAVARQVPAEGTPGGFTAVPLSSMASKGTFPEYDFSSVWTMGQSYPIQKVFTNLSIGSSTPVTKPDEDTVVIEDSEYIQQHLTFAQSNEYNQRMDQRMAKLLADAQNGAAANAGEAAYKILNSASELSKFKSLSIFDNPYDAILTELILSATNGEVDSLNSRIESKSLSLANSIWGMVKKVQPDYEAGTYQPAIVELLSKPESLKESSPALYRKLANALQDYLDEEGTRAALQTISGSMNFFGKVGDAVDWLGNCQDALEWVIDCANFVRVVEAYQDLSDEYVATLRQVASQMSGSTAYTAAFRSALDEYDSWLSQEVIAAAAIEHGVKGFAKLTADTLSPFTQMVMLDYCTSALGIPAAQAGAVIAAYNLGWSLSNTLTANDKVVESREIIRATYYVEKTLYDILQNDRSTLLQKKDLASAQKFDAAYCLLRTSEMYALQAYKDYLDATQTSFTQSLLHLGSKNFNNPEITLANFAILRWDAALCHGQAVRDQMVSEVIVACPTDLLVEDEAGDPVLTIEDGVVTTYAAGVSGAVSGEKKVLALSGGPYNISIFGTGTGTMDVSFTAYDSSTGRILKQSSYQSLPLTDSSYYEANLTLENTSAPSFTLSEDESAAGDEFPFTDVPTSAWFYDSVRNVYENYIMNGVSPTLFQPNGTMSRAMVATVLWRLEGEPEMDDTSVFTDVPRGQWYTQAITWAYEQGIITGYGGGRFGPQDNVTRQQLAAMLFRYAKTMDLDGGERATLSAYRDQGQVADWAREAFAWAVAKGHINGTSPTTLSPTGTATRAQCAAILTRMLAYEEPDA